MWHQRRRCDTNEEAEDVTQRRRWICDVNKDVTQRRGCDVNKEDEDVTKDEEELGPRCPPPWAVAPPPAAQWLSGCCPVEPAHTAARCLAQGQRSLSGRRGLKPRPSDDLPPLREEYLHDVGDAPEGLYLKIQLFVWQRTQKQKHPETWAAVSERIILDLCTGA